MDSRIEKILITKRQIKSAIKKAAKWIDNTYKDNEKDLVLVGLLRGCVPFYGQLSSEITVDMMMDFILVSSFRGKKTRMNKPVIETDIKIDITDKNVLLIDDIIDSGYTTEFVVEHLKQKKPNSIKIMTFLNKQAGRKNGFKADYYCFDIEDKFLVGYGLDYEEKMRNLPYVAVFKADKNGDKK